MESLLENNRINILVVSQNSLINKGIIIIISGESDIIVAAEVSTRSELIYSIDNHEEYILVQNAINCTKDFTLEILQLVQNLKPKAKIILV